MLDILYVVEFIEAVENWAGYGKLYDIWQNVPTIYCNQAVFNVFCELNCI